MQAKEVYSRACAVLLHNNKQHVLFISQVGIDASSRDDKDDDIESYVSLEYATLERLESRLRRLRQGFENLNKVTEY